MKVDPNQEVPIRLTKYEIATLLNQITTTWVEPANQKIIISVTNKLREAMKVEGSKLD